MPVIVCCDYTVYNPCFYFAAGGRGIHRQLDTKKRKTDVPVHSGSEFKSKVLSPKCVNVAIS